MDEDAVQAVRDSTIIMTISIDDEGEVRLTLCEIHMGAPKKTLSGTWPLADTISFNPTFHQWTVLIPFQLGLHLQKIIFKKVHFWVKRRHSIFGTSIPGQIRKTVPENLKVCHIWLIKFQKNYV